MYTLLAGLCFCTTLPLILVERRWGMKWRREREEKLQRKKEKKGQTTEAEHAEDAQRNDGADRPDTDKKQEMTKSGFTVDE